MLYIHVQPNSNGFLSGALLQISYLQVSHKVAENSLRDLKITETI